MGCPLVNGKLVQRWPGPLDKPGSVPVEFACPQCRAVGFLFLGVVLIKVMPLPSRVTVARGLPTTEAYFHIHVQGPVRSRKDLNRFALFRSADRDESGPWRSRLISTRIGCRVCAFFAISWLSSTVTTILVSEKDPERIDVDGEGSGRASHALVAHSKGCRLLRCEVGLPP